MTTITDEAVEAAATALNPWAWQEFDVICLTVTHARDKARSIARAALTAALPFMGVGEQGSSRDPGQHPCGEQPSPAVSATAPLAPCPFCGDDEPSFIGPPDAPAGMVFVGCETCGGRGMACGKYEAARQFWNRRWPPRATASPTPETSTEKVAATRQQEPWDEPIPTTPATVGGE